VDEGEYTYPIAIDIVLVVCDSVIREKERLDKIEHKEKMRVSRLRQTNWTSKRDVLSKYTRNRSINKRCNGRLCM